MNRSRPTTHVLMTTDSVGGVWPYSLDLAGATRHLGVRYTLACLGPVPTPAQRRRAASIGNLRLECMECKLEWMDDPWTDVEASGEWLRELEQRDQPDIVHLNGYAHGAQTFTAPVLIVAHSCVLSWWAAVKGCEAPEAWTKYRARVGAGLSAAERIVAPTLAMLGSVRRHYACGAPGRVIHNGRAHARPLAAPRGRLIAAVGRVWDEAKNIGALARAAASVPWPCVVAGDAASPEGHVAYMDNVKLLGRVPEDEVWALLERSAILAHPARYEPFGLAPLEGALAGCALVLGDIPTLRELWDGAAMFVDPDDTAALAAGLRRLVGDDRLRGEMALRARLRARRYGLARFGREYASLYQEMAALAAERRGLSTSQ